MSPPLRIKTKDFSCRFPLSGCLWSSHTPLPLLIEENIYMDSYKKKIAVDYENQLVIFFFVCVCVGILKR